MDIRSNDIKILGRIVATTVEGVVADAEQIYDATLQEKQSDLNQRIAAVTTVQDGDCVLVADKITSFSTLKFKNSRPQVGGECTVRYNINSIMLDTTSGTNPNINGVGTLFADNVSASAIGYHDSETENNFAEYDSQDETWNITNVGNISVSGNIVSDNYITCTDKLVIAAKEEDDSRSATLQYDYQSQELRLDSDLVLPNVILHNDDQNYANGVLCMSGKDLIINTEEKVHINGELKCIDDITIFNKNLTYSDEIKKDISVPVPSGFNSQHIDYTAYFGPFVPYSNIDNCIETGVYIVHTIEASSLHQHEIPYVPAILFVQSGYNTESQHPDNTYVIQTVLQVKADGTLYHDVRSRNYNGTWNKNFTLNNIDVPT